MLLYYVEYAFPPHLHNHGDEDTLAWTRFRPGFESEARAENEAMWLELDDSRYVYRVVEDK